MKVSAREAATLLGCSARTLRAKLARGELHGRKENGRWLIERRDLPLTESQRRSLQSKARRIRRAVEDALPSRLAQKHGDRSRTLTDLDAFRLGAELFAEVQAHHSVLDDESSGRVHEMLESGLLAIAEAAYQYDRAEGARLLSVRRRFIPLRKPASGAAFVAEGGWRMAGRGEAATVEAPRGADPLLPRPPRRPGLPHHPRWNRGVAAGARAPEEASGGRDGGVV